MAPRSRRFIFRSVQGKRRFNFVWDAIKLESPVIMTAAQFQFSGGVFGSAGRPVLGNPGQEPKVYVTNIGPHGSPGVEAGGVEFLVHAESNTPIPVMVTVTVFDPVESVDLFD
jgi:hypothetical protein